MQLTYTQCKQLASQDDLRSIVARLQDQPEFITCNEDLDFQDIQAVIQGGCDSGAYMPAVRYHTATETMAKHGTEVLEFIENAMGEIPQIKLDSTWGHVCVMFLSTAVELWCTQFDLDHVDWD